MGEVGQERGTDNIHDFPVSFPDAEVLSTFYPKLYDVQETPNA